MSKRLQVLVPDAEMEEILRIARRERITVGEWVRRALRTAKARTPVNEAEVKLKAVRRATNHAFPTADIDQMLSEISRGSES
jgi:hypothetical protein